MEKPLKEKGFSQSKTDQWQGMGVEKGEISGEMSWQHRTYLMQRQRMAVSHLYGVHRVVQRKPLFRNKIIPVE